MTHSVPVACVAVPVIVAFLDGSARPVLDAGPAEGQDVQVVRDGAAVGHLKAVRRDPVVGVDEGQEGSARFPHDPVLDGAGTHVLLVEHPQPPILGRQGIQDGFRAVGRAVVDRDDFEIGEGLVEDRAYAVLDIAFHVVTGDPDGYLDHLSRPQQIGRSLTSNL